MRKSKVRQILLGRWWEFREYWKINRFYFRHSRGAFEDSFVWEQVK
jgi:hypothetical protein